jgi:hypothetical protein
MMAELLPKYVLGHPYNKENSEKNCLSAFVGTNKSIIKRFTVNIK